MPFAAGTFSLFTPGNPVVTGTTIASTWANSTLVDIGTGLSTAILKDGTQTVTANIPFAGFKLTGMGTGTAATDAATVAQVQGSLSQYLTSVGGTGNAITATATPTATLAVGQVYRFLAAASNTAATTLTIGANSAGAIQSNEAALVGGEIQSGQEIEVFVSAATPVFQLIGNGATLPFIDTLPLVHGSADATKKLRFEVDGFTTGTTRVITPPDADITIPNFASQTANTVLAGPASGGAGATSFRALVGADGGSLVLIDSKTGSASSSLDFTTGVNSTYDDYELHFVEVLPATNGTRLFIRVSEDGGSTFKAGATDYRGALTFLNGAGTTGTVVGAATAIEMVDGTNGMRNAAIGFSGVVKFFKPSGTTASKQFIGSAIYEQATTTEIVDSRFSGRFQLDTNAINAIRVIFSAGNVASGSVYLYGVRKA